MRLSTFCGLHRDTEQFSVWQLQRAASSNQPFSWGRAGQTVLETTTHPGECYDKSFGIPSPHSPGLRTDGGKTSPEESAFGEKNFLYSFINTLIKTVKYKKLTKNQKKGPCMSWLLSWQLSRKSSVGFAYAAYIKKALAPS